MFEQKTNKKKHQSIKIKYEVPYQKKKKTINLKQPICPCNMDSKFVF